MEYIAHTPPHEHPDFLPHLYAAHIREMVEYGMSLLQYILAFSIMDKNEKQKISKTVEIALIFHDLGKLDDGNQRVLQGQQKGSLPVDHIDAGVAVADSMQNELAAWLIRGHHSPGLPSKKTEKQFIRQFNLETGMTLNSTSLRGLRNKRSKNADNLLKEDFINHANFIKRTDSNLTTYIERQKSCCGDWPNGTFMLPDNGILIRLLLSCLVDADHGSAGAYASGISLQPFYPVNPRWQERLQSINRYIKSLKQSASSPAEKERNELRSLFFQHCYLDKLYESKLAVCSAPVGLGKTTSVFTYLLRKSIKNKAGRIFVIAPYSNIIDQTVKVLRKAIVLEGENPEEIVVEHHNKADFSNKDMRQYTVLWRAPVVVTTAVQFFETLASADPTKLRKMHAIAGSSIFIDESHACFPAWLLRISWYWLKKLAQDWNCNIVFSSGSIVEFWNDEYFVEKNDKVKLPDIIPYDLKIRAIKTEASRVVYKQSEKALYLNEIISNALDKKIWNNLDIEIRPSCLIIMNTVQSAAIVAYTLSSSLNDLDNHIDSRKVLHLSTALAPKDRVEILKEIERRQDDSEWNYKTWYLIATSCVEAGINLDFTIGFRERCSVTSFLQVAGRINRHGIRSAGILYDFTTILENGLNKHPSFDDSCIVFTELWSDIIQQKRSLMEISTDAIRKEYSRVVEKERERSLAIYSEEKKLDFQEVSHDYRIIEAATATVIIDAGIADKLEYGIPVCWQTIQKYSVQLWYTKIKKLGLKPINRCMHDNIYSWIATYDYDPNFLGIMGGVLKLEELFYENGGII